MGSQWNIESEHEPPLIIILTIVVVSKESATLRNLK